MRRAKSGWELPGTARGRPLHCAGGRVSNRRAGWQKLLWFGGMSRETLVPQPDWETPATLAIIAPGVFPRWTPLESHMVVRSGLAELGKWVSDERDVYEDYRTHIGGSARKLVNVWLLGVSLFQRRSGSCRFADMEVSQPGIATRRL